MHPDLDQLVLLFYRSRAPLGEFTPVGAEELPEPYRRLLAHDEHMTVTLESHHDSPVEVRVLEARLTDGHYARRIILHRQRDRRPVLFGLVRLDFQFVDDAVRRDIESQQIPLGRVLIEHNVLRHVELVQLWKIVPGPELRALLGLTGPDARTVYGRTALIHCNSAPAVELLEVVNG